MEKREKERDRRREGRGEKRREKGRGEKRREKGGGREEERKRERKEEGEERGRSIVAPIRFMIDEFHYYSCSTLHVGKIQYS